MSGERYELLERVGVGSFATVYRARDTELGREVAVKQIHEQYLHLPEQMERYWQEAQLLASLQHPNVITFFDIDRERGWLIMELMQGNLAERIKEEPLDLRSVRTTLAHCLRALKYLHSQGIVHGDLKPSNMMIDARKRIKVGDFGLARRVSDEDGSLLKGTTRYMAPEVVSDEFGEVGPASDLYSLGFATYELMCGPNFESLFPGLNAFGRDKQIAWMMWHAASDRRLPEISRVLQGVPEDLAHVVEKLVEKDQSARYQSADEALSDLQIDLKIVKTGAEPVEEPQSNNRRTLAIVAFTFSLVLSLAMLFLPGGDDDEKRQVDLHSPVAGVVGVVRVDDGIISVTGSDGVPVDVKLGNRPKILLNKKTYITPSELQPDDRVVVNWTTDADGYERVEVDVSRPDESIGIISSIQPRIEQFSMQITEGDQRGELILRARETTRIRLNGERATFAALREADEVTVRHIPDDELLNARVATEIVALQKRKLEGFIRDVAKESLTIEVNRQGKATLVKLPLADEVEVTLNGKKIVDGKLLKPADLEAGDRVKMTHHESIVEVQSLRQFLHVGTLLEVQPASRSLVVSAENDDRKAFIIRDDCSVTINGEEARSGDLRRNDKLEVTFDNANQQNDVYAIDAIRPVDKRRFAIVIGVQDYDDKSLSPVEHAADGAELLHETLINRYGVDPQQSLLLKNETRVRIEQAIPNWLKKTDEDSQVLVAFTGHAYLDDEGRPFLAAKDFDLARASQSGLALSWLREQLEACPAGEKLLLLDCCHAGEGSDLEQQPSPSVMLRAVQPERDPAVFRSTYAIASCGDAERGLVLPDRNHRLFGWYVSQAYSGQADANADVHLEPTELFDYLETTLAGVKVDNFSQTPVLHIPDATPPPMDRLSAEAKEAVRNLIANHWSSRRLLPTVESEFVAASRLAGDEPDAQLAYALLLLKTRKYADAQRYLDQVKLAQPHVSITRETLGWTFSHTGRHERGVAEFAELFTQRLEASPDAPVDANVKRVLRLAGQVRQFAVEAAEEARRLDESKVTVLDEAVAKLGDEAVAIFDLGRKNVTEKYADYEKQISADRNSSKAKLLDLERKRLTSYAPFDFEQARRIVIAGLELQKLP